MPPKLLACIRFLYKVVHKIGLLRKFNLAREIEFNFFFIAWTIFLKLGTLVRHVHGYKRGLPQIFRAVATKKKLVRPKYMENVERGVMVSLVKQDKPCAARPFSSWGSGGHCKPPSGVRGRAPEAFENFTLSHHKVDWF